MMVVATDGEIGEIEEVFFDDRSWIVRYLVVRMSSEDQYDRFVLIPSKLVKRFDETGQRAFVALTRAQVQNSPDVDTHQPVSRQHEKALAEYYRYPQYWTDPFPLGELFGLGEWAERGVERRKGLRLVEERLRSSTEVIGYDTRALDGLVGHIDDLLIDEENWTIRYLMINTRNWLPGDHVLVATAWVDQFSWEEGRVFVKLTKEAIKHCPLFDETSITPQSEADLYRHHGHTRS